MSGELDQAKYDLLRTAAEQYAAALGEHGDIAETDGYLRLYYRHVAPEDLIGRPPAEVYGPAMAHRNLGAERPQGRAKVRVFNPSEETDGWEEQGRTVVQVVTDDMPFLVDSVSMEVSRHKLTTFLTVHPLLGVDRDVAGRLRTFRGKRDSDHDLDESWIHVEIGRISDPAALAELENDLLRVLNDVRVAYEDQEKMRERALTLAREIADNPPLRGDEADEAVELLDWLAGGHFTFLGYRDYALADDGSALRPVTGTGLGILRTDTSESGSFAALPPEVRKRATERHLLVITKANSRSTVHRAVYLDYIGVKKFDDHGSVVGERRFLGLFAHVAYSESIAHVPVLKRKVDEVLDRTGFTPDSYDGQELIEILESYPRDELFQISPDELLPIAVGVLRLRERRQLKLFLRKDPYGRFMSCMVYLPRDRYTTKVRLRIQEILRSAFEGVSVDYSANVTESVLARLHVVVRGERGHRLPDVDAEALERRLANATRSWTDFLADAIRRECGDQRAPELTARYGDAFPEGYKADFTATTAVSDLRRLDALGADGDTSIDLWEPAGADAGARRLKIYRRGEPIILSNVLPLLQNMGVEVIDERPYEIMPQGGPRAWIYDLGLRYTPTPGAPQDAVKELFQDAFLALWEGRIENDGFNALVLRVGLDWRQTMILRAYALYLRQTGTSFSKRYIEQVLLNNPGITRLLVRLWESRLDPQLAGGEIERSIGIFEELEGRLEDVQSLDEDRILRAYLAMIQATLRTNHYQGKPYLSLKFDPEGIPDLPLPRPKFEIFVYSPKVEGVHLRFGSVARGGLRWSDRREDFRTEILGLVKAQAVKNTVIVPAGAKGGFVGKQLPDPSDREAWMKAGIDCYKDFISGLLDVTDNLVDGKVVPPEKVVRHDGDDTYLVVAADKGTATFSDIANGLAAEYGFWLGDAFASGGSVGYDHKAMGITARGAWESVKYHFRVLNLDVQKDDFTVVGIGDMSGDVFGNGMLLSEHIKLVAAFDHRHVFLDPDPDPERSFAERRRLFEMPRSTWADYDTSLISQGGGVFPRTAKSIRLSPEIRAALGIPEGVNALTPYELIRAALLAPVDLLWNGGIGTYVKASTENNAEVGDKANDLVRVDGADLRCRVVGEGGNLGLTQLGRIEFARKGGLVNTDFIDNSAGVDTSDHEVNIKILLDQVVRDGRLERKQRDELLYSMTDEVGRLVLRDNCAQNVVLAAARAQAGSMLHVHTRMMRALERDGLLKRRLEFLPDDKALAERRQAGRGLTGPEFSVLLAYAKLSLDDDLIASDLPDDQYLESWLVDYFPTPLRERFRPEMDRHPLRREIITTAVVNDLVNNSGTTFAFRVHEETGASPSDIARAYLVAREVFDMPRFWSAVDGLSHQVEESAQIALLLEARKLTERGSRWLLHHRRPPFDIRATVDFFLEDAVTLAAHIPKVLTGLDSAAYEERRDAYLAMGVPADLADRAAVLVPAYSTFDLVSIARDIDRPVTEVAEVYFTLANKLQLTRLREPIIALPRDDRWRSMARAALRDDLYQAHAQLTRAVLGLSEPGTSADESIARWSERNSAPIARAQQTLLEIWESDSFDLATLSVALGAVRTLATTSSID
ncbi:NAD-glutamate dehydrogenase [Actinomadura rayongensis]|uniref:NAD-glutamate dehydrogenase n=1 Tax=Actinomadura rayongensis TaxID=1429076 RepID=A0A6I4W8H8_9ACTN|nr:NAD-glutamate dehydrogenase [Actinomadura rayongensis]MXQ64555.1 NAD-glutamate dehydrogenase [Actinomadura rayongensis]